MKLFRNHSTQNTITRRDQNKRHPPSVIHQIHIVHSSPPLPPVAINDLILHD